MRRRVGRCLKQLVKNVLFYDASMVPTEYPRDKLVFISGDFIDREKFSAEPDLHLHLAIVPIEVVECDAIYNADLFVAEYMRIANVRDADYVRRVVEPTHYHTLLEAYDAQLVPVYDVAGSPAEIAGWCIESYLKSLL